MNDAEAILRALRYDLTAAQAKVTEALEVLARLDLPDPADTRCPTCGAGLRGKRSLAEHAYHSHDGPVPAHWIAAEAQASE